MAVAPDPRPVEFVFEQPLSVGLAIARASTGRDLELAAEMVRAVSEGYWCGVEHLADQCGHLPDDQRGHFSPGLLQVEVHEHDTLASKTDQHLRLHAHVVVETTLRTGRSVNISRLRDAAISAQTTVVAETMAAFSELGVAISEGTRTPARREVSVLHAQALAIPRVMTCPPVRRARLQDLPLDRWDPVVCPQRFQLASGS